MRSACEPPEVVADPVVRIEALRSRYRDGDFALHVPALAIARGGSVAIIGPSGSGKTTLLNLVAGIRLPDAGRVVVDGTDVATLGDAARRRFRVRRIGLIFQDFELLGYLSVLDNILLPWRLDASLTLDADVRTRATALAERVGVADALRRRATRLSQGERQRVALCRALLTRPELLLADEPTGSLDPGNTGRVIDLLFECAEEAGATLVMVTHDHDLLDRFDRTIDFRAFHA